MKRLPYLAVVMLVLMTMSTGVLSQERATAKQEPAANAENIRSIEGTTWAGTDSDGDFYEYTFLKGGQLRYKTNTSRKKIVTFEDKGDVWAQNGEIVIILSGDFSTQVGTLRRDRIAGKAWNVKERRWTWEVKKNR